MFEEDTFETSAGELRVTCVGHGTLMFTLGQTVIHVDPVSGEADYGAMPKADVILVTHEHGDHLDPQAIAAIRKEGTTVILTEQCARAVSGGIGSGQQLVDARVAGRRYRHADANHAARCIALPSTRLDGRANALRSDAGVSPVGLRHQHD